MNTSTNFLPMVQYGGGFLNQKGRGNTRETAGGGTCYYTCAGGSTCTYPCDEQITTIRSCCRAQGDDYFPVATGGTPKSNFLPIRRDKRGFGVGQDRSYSGQCRTGSDCVSGRPSDCSPCLSECINGTCEYSQMSPVAPTGKTKSFSGTYWQQDTPVGTGWQQKGVFNNFSAGNGGMVKAGTGTSTAKYMLGLLSVGVLFYVIGYSLKEGKQFA